MTGKIYMNDQRITVDTNILIYSVDVDAGDKHKFAMQLMDELVDKNCVLTLQALSEFYSAATRKGKATVEEAQSQITDWQIVFPIIAAKASTLSMAVKATSTYKLSFWDAMIWATARQNGVEVLMSEDFQHGQNIEGVYIQNPFEHEIK